MGDMRQQEKAEYRRLLEEIGEDYCCQKDKYCIFKEFLISAHPSKRLLVQLKCVDKWKFESSEQEHGDIGWDKAMSSWMSEGYAEAFAEAYAEGKSTKDIYTETMKSVKGRAVDAKPS